MIINPNIRPPCGKDSAFPIIPNLFGCWQMWNPDRQNVKIKYNVTKMKNYANPATPPWIDPYAAANFNGSSCSPYASDPPENFVCGDGVNGNIFCWPIDDSYVQSCNGTSSISFPVGDFHNCYSQSNDTHSSTTCRDIGFKSLYAQKTWVGKLAYTSRDELAGGISDRAVLDCWDWCCDGCTVHNADTGSPDNTKYRTLSATSTENLHTDVYICGPPDPPPEGDFCCSDEFTPCDCGSDGCPGGVPISCTVCTFDHSTDYGGDASATTTIDVHGNVVVASCASSSHGCQGEDTSDCEAQESARMLGALGAANSNVGTLINLWCAYLQQFGNFASPDVVTSDGCGTWHLEWHTTVTLCTAACGGAEDFTVEPVSIMDITPSSLNVYSYGADRPQSGCNNEEHCVTWIETNHSTWTYSATGFDFVSDTTGEGSISFNQQYHQEVHGSLGDAYTTQQVYADLVDNLLAQWDIGDIEQYPWRGDANKTLGPVVKYDEGGGEPSVPMCVTSALHTGTILGKPGPLGIDRIFDPSHPNWCICTFINDSEELCYIPYIRDYGAWSTDSGVPRATAWLNNLEANNMPDGTFLGANFSWTSPSTCNLDAPAHVQYDDVLYACIYAESNYSKQSFNYSRPIGVDRFQYSGSSPRCIVSSSLSSSGNMVSIENSGPTTNIPANSLVWVCGTGVLDGLWTGSGDGLYIVTLTEPRMVSASQIASQPVDTCGSGLIYQLRWDPLKPAICGRVAIDSTTNLTPVTCSVTDGMYLVNGDLVTITGSTGILSINGTHPVIVIDSTHFVVSGSVSSSMSYAGGGQVYSPDAPDWKWCDVGSKGDFTYKTWLFNYRDVGEYNRALGEYNWNLGIPYDCTTGPAANCSILPTVPSEPRPYQGPCGLDQNVVSMSCNTSCVPYNPCRVNAVYFAPSNLTESFNKSGSNLNYSVNLGWAPGVITSNPIDHDYTTMWQAIPAQAMDDLYFQPPPCECISYTDPNTFITTFECDPNCSWQEDDGTCEPDNPGDPDLSIPCQKFYAARNVYEARCAPPSGSPAIQSGVYMGCLQPSDFTSATCPNGNICNAPVGTQGVFPEETTCAAYKQHNVEAPWFLLFAKEGCVCFDGRFSSNYMANGVSCPVDIVPPP